MSTSKLRWTIPVGIAAAAVTASATLPALTAGADSALPEVTAQQLLSRTLASDVDTFSGTVRSEADLGIPALPDSVRSSDLSSLLTGTGTMRVAKSGADRQRLSVLGSNSERTYLRDGRVAWMYDSAEREAVRTKLPARADDERHERVSPDEAAKRLLAKVGEDSDVSVGRAGEVAGRDAYELVVKPEPTESLVGSVQVSIDAKTWMPLGVTVLPRGSSDPAVDVAFTELSYAEPAASTFEFDPPKGTKVKNRTVEAGDRDHGRHQKAGKDHGAEPSWTRVVELGEKGSKPTGEAGAYLKQLQAAGTRVTGEYGSGTMIRSRLLTVLVLDDGRMFAGAVTPAVVERAAAKG